MTKSQKLQQVMLGWFLEETSPMAYSISEQILIDSLFEQRDAWMNAMGMCDLCYCQEWNCSCTNCKWAGNTRIDIEAVEAAL